MTTKQHGRRSTTRAKNGKRRVAGRATAARGRNGGAASTSSSGIHSHKKRAGSVARKSAPRRRAPRVTSSGLAETLRKQTRHGLVVAREKLEVARKVAGRTLNAVATTALHVVEGVKGKLAHA